MARLVENLINIGPKMAGYLHELDIHTEDDLRERGVMRVYQQMGERWPHLVHKMALYALYGALTDQNCLCLPEETKDWLHEQLYSL